MDLKKINSNIKLIAKNAQKLNELIHETAVGCIAHCMEHKDCTPALRLVMAMPKSHRRGLLIEWFATYSPIGMNVNQGKCGLHKPASKAYRDFDIDGAKANPFYEGAKADNEDLPDTTLEDSNKAIFAVANKLQKKLDNGEVAANDVEAITAQVVALKRVGQMQRKPTQGNAAPEVVGKPAAKRAA